nr:zinc finger C2H2-type/integrase DNA-binding domain-containing protein [Tanacetum cinerariifolium]
MRVHVMYHKNSPFKTGSKLFKKIEDNQDFSGGAKGNEGLKVTSNKPQLSSVNDEGVPTCFQCVNSFPSMKSLSAHMRCHPDRFWPGIIPPPNAVLAQGNPQVVGSKSSSLSCNSNVVCDYGGGHVVEDHESKKVQMEMDDHESDSKNSDKNSCVVNQAPKVIAPIVEVIPQVDADSTGSPSSTTVNQDASSSSKSHTTTEIQSLVIPQDVGDDNLDMEVAHMGNDPFLGVP